MLERRHNGELPRRASHAILRVARWAALVGTLLGSVSSRAVESEALARAKENVAYEHAHLGLVGSLFCNREVAQMD